MDNHYAEETIRTLEWWAEKNEKLGPQGYRVLKDDTGQRDYRIINLGSYG